MAMTQSNAHDIIWYSSQYMAVLSIQYTHEVVPMAPSANSHSTLQYTTYSIIMN